MMVYRAGVVAVVLASVFMLGCPDRPERFTGDDDAGPVVYDESEIAAWDHCPPRALFSPEAGRLWIQTTLDATYCASLILGADPKDDFASKHQWRLVPADLFLPLTEGVHQVQVSTCDQTRNGEVAGTSASAATWTVERESVLGTPFFEGTLLQPYPDGSAFRIQISGLDATIPRYDVDTGGGILLDGSHRAPGVAPSVTLAFCADGTCADSRRTFASCSLPLTDDDAPIEDLIHLSIEGGEIDFFFDVAPDDEEFSLVRRIAGEFRGETIAVSTTSAADAYWHTTMTRFGMSTWRDFVFQLEPPIDDVCFLDFSGVDRTRSSFETEAHDCGAERGETLRSLALSYDALD